MVIYVIILTISRPHCIYIYWMRAVVLCHLRYVGRRLATNSRPTPIPWWCAMMPTLYTWSPNHSKSFEVDRLYIRLWRSVGTTCPGASLCVAQSHDVHNASCKSNDLQTLSPRTLWPLGLSITILRRAGREHSVMIIANCRRNALCHSPPSCMLLFLYIKIYNTNAGVVRRRISVKIHERRFCGVHRGHYGVF